MKVQSWNRTWPSNCTSYVPLHLCIATVPMANCHNVSLEAYGRMFCWELAVEWGYAYESRQTATRGLNIGMLHYGESEHGKRQENETFYKHKKCPLTSLRERPWPFSKNYLHINPSIDNRSRTLDSCVEKRGLIPPEIRIKGLLLFKVSIYD